MKEPSSLPAQNADERSALGRRFARAATQRRRRRPRLPSEGETDSPPVCQIIFQKAAYPSEWLPSAISLVEYAVVAMLTAVFESWHIGNGNYPPLRRGEQVNLSFEIEPLAIDPLAADEPESFVHLESGEHDFEVLP